jgi:hypothetical protein
MIGGPSSLEGNRESFTRQKTLNLLEKTRGSSKPFDIQITIALGERDVDYPSTVAASPVGQSSTDSGAAPVSSNGKSN